MELSRALAVRIAPSQVGSVEFAASRFGTRLVVVLGHSGCGAIIATLEEVTGHATNQSRNLRSIVDRVRPSIETLLSGHRNLDSETLIREAVRANVRVSVDHLRHGSALLEQLRAFPNSVVLQKPYSLTRACEAVASLLKSASSNVFAS